MMIGRILSLALLASCSFSTLALAEPNPEKWAGDIARFAEQDKANPPAAGGIVLTGSSSFARWKDVAKELPDEQVINRAFGGSSFPEVNHYLDRIVIPYKPRLVFVFCGTNDMASHGRTPEQVLADFQAFVAKIHKELPETEIVYVSIHMSPGREKLHEKFRETNRMIAAECEKSKLLHYLDVVDTMLGPDGKPDPGMYVDPLHPTAKAYVKWGEKLRRVVKEIDNSPKRE